MDKALSKILEEYTINSAPTISKATEPLRKHFNIDVFYHVYVNSEGDYWWTGSHAQCSQYVAEKQLCLHAPHIMHPSKIVSGYLRPDKLTHIPYYQQLTQTHLELLNAQNLCIFIKKYQDHYELYTFGTTQQSHDTENFYCSPHLQQQFIQYFLECTEALRKKAQSQCYNLVANDANYFNLAQTTPVPHIHVDGYKQYIGDTTIMTLQQFTNREVDCIKALLLGKTANGTAQELGISSRTVETHINNIRKKLGVKYKSEIVARVVSDKLLSSLLLEM